MYTPSFNRETRPEPILQLIREHGFATLLAGDQVSHLPLILEGENLIGHMARANPQWRAISQPVTAIFTGPHAYISPAWYPPKPDNVPTWNYAVVHAKGRFEILEGAEAERVMRTLVETFESRYQTGWALPNGEPEIAAMMREIVVFRLVDLEFKAKFKLSQKQDSAIRNNVIAELEARGGELADVAEYMKDAKI